MAGNSKKNARTKKGKKKLPFFKKLQIILVALAAVVIFRQTIIMVVIGLLPSIVAFIVDDTRSRSWAKSVSACNLAGLLPFVVEVYFYAGNSVGAMQEKMADFLMWLVVYGAAGLAWLFIWGMPKVAMVFYRVYYTYRIQEHQKALLKLRDEWGAEIKK
jgi:hypothetical protein